MEAIFFGQGAANEIPFGRVWPVPPRLPEGEPDRMARELVPGWNEKGRWRSKPEESGHFDLGPIEIGDDRITEIKRFNGTFEDCLPVYEALIRGGSTLEIDAPDLLERSAEAGLGTPAVPGIGGKPEGEGSFRICGLVKMNSA